MVRNKKNLKFLLVGGLAIAFASCADDAMNGNLSNGADTIESSLKTANVSVGQLSQTYVSNVDKWSKTNTRAASSWDDIFDYSLPATAVDITKDGFDTNAEVYYVPEGDHGDINFHWSANINNAKVLYLKGSATFTDINMPNNLKVYIDCNYSPAKLGNNWNNIDFIVLEKGELTVNEVGCNNSKLYSIGTVNFPNGITYGNIPEIYNSGELNIGEEGKSIGIGDNVTIYSDKGIVNLEGNIDFKAACDIQGTVNVNGDLTLQNSRDQYMCGVEVSGKLYVNADNFSASYIKAETIELNGKKVHLLPEALVEADKLILPNGGCAFLAYDGSYALIRVKDVEFDNNNNFRDSFSNDIYFDVTGSIKIKEYFNVDNGNGGYQQNYDFNVYPTAADYIVSQNGAAVADRFNQEISGAPACGPNYGTTPPEVVNKPTLELIASVESHDHNSDKATGRKLSATAVDWDGNTIYVSYHMRGGNYANDYYDNDDDVEGCIETWQFNTNEQNQTIIELGKFMWTKEFDFNHILIDGSDIITVGHKDDKGAIIGRLNNTFTNFIPSFDGGITTSADLSYKYLTTDVELYDDYYNPNQGTTTNQKVDYENAGDGNCLIKVGDKYFVTTYAGYGLINADDFSRVKDESGNVAFVSTEGSVKHIINKGNDEVALLSLTSRPEVTSDASSGAEVIVMGKDAFPFGGRSTSLDGFVQPVDGKNVLAWDETSGNMYACLGKGGLSVNGTVYKFGEDNAEPVNGVAIDNEYVYLASGSHIRVLDKNTLAEVTHYSNPNMSSNFIKLVEYNGDKYILAAYGQSGVKVFRFNPGN